MTTTARPGDLIATPEQLITVPPGAVMLSTKPDAVPWLWTEDVTSSDDAVAYWWPFLADDAPLIVLFVPGYPPRSEFVVKAEALRDAAASCVDWDVVYGHEPSTPEVDAGHQVADWLMREADRLERR